MRNPKPIQINIPNPCSQNWNQMTPAEQGRFCANCQKRLVDFTGYSDADLYHFFSKNTGNVCGRVLTSQLNRNIAISPQPHSRLYILFIGLGLTLLLTQVPSVSARPLPPVVIENAFYVQESSAGSEDSIQLKILVLDEKKEPMTGVITQLLNGKECIDTGITDADGNVLLKLSKQVDLSDAFIKVAYQSYKTQVIALNKKSTKTPVIIQMKVDATIGLMEIKLTNYTIPLIDVYEPEKHSFSAEDIERMPAR